MDSIMAKPTNKVRVIVAEDHFAPLYAIAVSYKVGSRDERQGRTGFAHLFEHMMFKGSENVGTGELDFLIFTNGGNSNGTTDTDRTSYFEVLPKNQLDLGLFLEADRMRGLVITLDNLENQRQAVKEERRQSVDNQAYGQTDERLEELIYDNFAYHHSVIGSMDDLDAVVMHALVKDRVRARAVAKLTGETLARPVQHRLAVQPRRQVDRAPPRDA